MIETRYVLRDENLELMDKYLTNNARSIPKLIALDAETFEEIGTWGPRPQTAMDYFYQLKNQGMEKPEMMEKIQRWYLADKERALQAEFVELLESWNDAKRFGFKRLKIIFACSISSAIKSRITEEIMAEKRISDSEGNNIVSCVAVLFIFIVSIGYVYYRDAN